MSPSDCPAISGHEEVRARNTAYGDGTSLMEFPSAGIKNCCGLFRGPQDLLSILTDTDWDYMNGILMTKLLIMIPRVCFDGHRLRVKF